LRVSPRGKRVWFLRYRIPGEGERRERLGTFPEMSLGSARKRARGILGRVAGGEDPREDPVEEEVGVLSFKDAAERALSLMARRTRERTIQERRRILNRELLPSWGDRPVSEIRRGDVAALVEGIAGRGAPVMANRTLSLVRAIFNALLDMELAEANPATRPGRFMEEESPRERSLSREELKAILKAAEEEGPEARTFLSLVLFTAQRAGAVAAARWEEFDLGAGTWRIPPEPGRKFTKFPRLVPLNDGARGALRILAEETGVEGPYLFPARGGAKAATMKGWHNLAARIRRRSKVDGWTFHDFRRTFRGLATRALGVRPDVADAVLGHTIGTVGHVHYEADKTGYLLEEKRAALGGWGSYLDRLLKEGGSDDG
jgi:integrase